MTSSSSPADVALSSALSRLQLEVLVPRSYRKSSHLEANLQHLTLSSEDQASRWNWRDVLGAALTTDAGKEIQENADYDVNAVYHLSISACPVVPSKKPDPNARERDLMVWKLAIAGASVADAIIVRDWINFLADPRNEEAIHQATTLEALTLAPQKPRRFLVLVNPASGKGKAEKLYEKKIAPVLKASNIQADVQLTERPQHGKEIAMTLPLNTFDCVAAVGGDGTLSEILQGLMEREDWQDAILQPFGAIPGGSGNGLAATVLHAAHEKIDILNASYVLAKGAPQPLDLASVRNPHGDSMYSFLSIAWASIADIDIESEMLRFLGVLRFTVVLLWKVYCSRHLYPGTIWYLDDGDVDRSEVPERRPDMPRPGFDLVDEIEDPQQEEKPAEDGKPHWKRMDSELLLYWNMNVSHATTENNVAPMAKLGDGYNYMVMIDSKNNTPRSAMVDLMIDSATGTALEKPAVSMIKTRAFKIIPKDPEDRISVDGELFRGPVDVQVHPRLARLIALSPEAAEAS